MEMLPENCLAQVMSFTSPQDTCRSSSTSLAYRSAADSDVVWERFLPFDYQEILSRSSSPAKFSSKKELYFYLCNPVLIDGGKMTFLLDRRTGKKCYLMSARELSITWANNTMYWSWKSLAESRFSEVAELRMVDWLEIHGKIKMKMLSPGTNYCAFFVFKLTKRSYGLDTLPFELSVEVKNQQSRSSGYLCHRDVRKESLEKICFAHRIEALSDRVTNGETQIPCLRDDGWMEIKLGEFINEGGECENEDVKLSLMEVKGYHLKGGIIIEGIEIRPKC